MVSPLVGKMRNAYTAAHEEVARAKRLRLSREEVQEVENLELAKREAKEAAKDSLKDNKKTPAATKVALEESLGRKHPGTPGLTGKLHSAVGRKFLQTLLKTKKEGSYELPRWEER